MHEMDQIFDRVLVLKSQTGDSKALEELYLRHNERVGYYLRRMLNHDPSAAADVQQEVWLKVIRRIGQLKHAEAFVVWLYRIARSRALNHRAGSKLFQTLSDETLENLPAEDDEEDRLSPADAAGIHAAITTLAPPHREVILLRFLEDLPYEHIAEIVGCSVGTVRSRLFYAKRALKPELEKYYDRESSNVASR